MKPVTGRIYNISKSQAFKISKEGSAIVVKVKKKMCLGVLGSQCYTAVAGLSCSRGVWYIYDWDTG